MYREGPDVLAPCLKSLVLESGRPKFKPRLCNYNFHETIGKLLSPSAPHLTQP